MKNQFFLLIFFLGITIPSWTQVSSGKVTYKVTMDEKMTDSILNQEDMMPELRSGLNSLFNRQAKTLPHLFYQLEFTAQESHFYTSNTMQNDNNIDLEKIAENVGAYGNYYINLEEKKSYHQFNYIKTDLIITNPTDFNWKISTETKVIEGYQCYKATTSHKPDVGLGGQVTVWFAPDIPFQVGPLVYAGLPGLILELKQGYYTFTANEVKLSEKNISFKKPKKGKEIKLKDFPKEQEKIKANYIRASSY